MGQFMECHFVSLRFVLALGENLFNDLSFAIVFLSGQSKIYTSNTSLDL